MWSNFKYQAQPTKDKENDMNAPTDIRKEIVFIQVNKFNTIHNKADIGLSGDGTTITGSSDNNGGSSGGDSGGNSGGDSGEEAPDPAA